MSSEPPAKRPKPPLPGGCAAVSKAVAGGAPVLAVALGGGSDVVGGLALARALGATRAILVQPGSPARGTEAPPTPQLTKVEAAAADAEHPGGAFYDNASMLSYLLRLAPDAPDDPDWRAPLQSYLHSGAVRLLNRAARLRWGMGRARMGTLYPLAGAAHARWRTRAPTGPRRS